MKSGSFLPSNRNPFWTLLGVGILASTLGLTYLLATRGPRQIPVQEVQAPLPGKGVLGSLGTLTEQMGDARFDLHYARIRGGEKDLNLEEVTGKLSEAEAVWNLKGPSAQRAQEGVWGMNGPVSIQGLDPSGRFLGKGEILGQGEVLRWERGVWRGLAPMEWETMEGPGKGHWTLPAGWNRNQEGVLTVEKGPVTWKALPGGNLQRIDTESLALGRGFLGGRMGRVIASFEDGVLRAPSAEFTPASIRWGSPLAFERADGWKGEADGGTVPRPAPGSPLQSMEFHRFRGMRSSPAGTERVEAEGARWTRAGLRLEGSVLWEQPLDGDRLRMRAPRVLMREGPGPDLPEDLPVGNGRAEGQPVLTWGRRSLSSPRMEVNRASRTWKLQGPVLGKAEEGAFSAQSGVGSPRSWSFEGPVTLSLTGGGELRGLRLTWEGETWTLTGRPATWVGPRERLSGHRLVRRGETLVFPEGLSGSLATTEGDLLLRADRGERQKGRLLVEGRVDCQGQGWRLRADQILAEVGAGRTVQRVSARGRVSLTGQLGAGSGESLELEPQSGKVTWAGRVRGSAEVKAW